VSLFVVDFKVVACIGLQGDCVLCPVQFCYFRKWQTLKNNAYASGCCFRLGKLVQKHFRC